jgi:hypothetical protein
MVRITLNRLGLFFMLFSHYGYSHQSPSTQGGQGLLNELLVYCPHAGITIVSENPSTVTSTLAG